MVSGYNRGGVTIHAPSGDGNKNSASQAYGTARLQSTPRQGTEMLLGYPPRQAIAVTIHAPSGDGNAAYRPCRSDPRHVTIHAPSGDGNNDYGSAFEYQRVTIHAPSGDGNTLELDHIPVLGCYNPRPVRGRKYPEGWFQVPDPALQSTPRQGTTIPYDPYDYELQFLPR